MKTFLTFLIYILQTSLFLVSGQKIQIYLGTGECSNCYTSFSSLKDLKGYEKQILIYNGDSAVVDEMIAGFDLPKDLTFIYTRETLGSNSYCKVISNNVQVDSFPFRALSSKIAHLNKIIPFTKHNRIYFPKTLVLNKSRLDILVSGDAVNIYDYTLGKSVYFKIRKGKDSVEGFSEIKGSHYNYRTFFKYGAFDTTFYVNTYSILKQMKMAEPRIERTFINDTSLNLILNLRYPTLNSKDANDTMIMSALFLFQRNLVNSKNHLRYIEGTLDLYEKSNGQYLFSQNLPFYFRDSKVLFSVYNLKEDKSPTKVLSVWGINDNKRITFIEYDSFITSTEQEEGFKLNDKYFLINSKFYFNPTLSIIKQYHSNDHYEINDIVKDKERSFCNDIALQNNTFRALVFTDTILELYEYDIKSKEILSVRLIPLLEDYLINSVKFLDFNTLLFLDSKLGSIHLIRAE